jgi:hypothetical protein
MRLRFLKRPSLAFASLAALASSAIALGVAVRSGADIQVAPTPTFAAATTFDPADLAQYGIRLEALPVTELPPAISADQATLQAVLLAPDLPQTARVPASATETVAGQCVGVGEAGRSTFSRRCWAVALPPPAATVAIPGGEPATVTPRHYVAFVDAQTGELIQATMWSTDG